MLPRRALLLIGLAAGCQAYTPGSLTVSGPLGQVSTVGCLDIAVEPEADAQAVGPVARITFANRCDAAVRVNLASIRAHGELADGRRVAMHLFDPDLVVRPGMLEARRVGREIIEFQSSEGATIQPAALCLDLSRVDADAGLDRPTIVCVGRGMNRLAEVAR